MRVYGWPFWPAVRVGFWWRLEHLPYRGGEGGLCGHVTRRAYGYRKAAERRAGTTMSERET